MSSLRGASSYARLMAVLVRWSWRRGSASPSAFVPSGVEEQHDDVSQSRLSMIVLILRVLLVEYRRSEQPFSAPLFLFFAHVHVVFRRCFVGLILAAQCDFREPQAMLSHVIAPDQRAGLAVALGWSHARRLFAGRRSLHGRQLRTIRSRPGPHRAANRIDGAANAAHPRVVLGRPAADTKAGRAPGMIDH
jgi:hypothetical protein